MITHFFHEILPDGYGAWIAALVLFFLSLSLLSLLRRMLWKRFEDSLARVKGGVGPLLLDVSLLPIRLLTLLTALVLCVQVLPESVRTHMGINHAFRMAFTLLFIWLINRWGEVFLKKGTLPIVVGEGTRNILATVFKAVVLGLGLLILLDTLGISITPILASLGVGSVAVALALQDTLSNFFSGLYILADSPIRIGDFIEAGDGIEGQVVKIGWRSTRILRSTNNLIIVPNAKLATSVVTNYDLPERESSISFKLGVAYESDLEKVERVTCEVARQVLRRIPGGVETFEPFIRYNELADSSINFSVVFRVHHVNDQHVLKHEFIKALHIRYSQEGISIPYPQRVVHVLKEVDGANKASHAHHHQS